MIDLGDIKAKDYFKAVKYGNTETIPEFERINDLFFTLRDNGQDKFELKNNLTLSQLHFKLSNVVLAKSIYQSLPLDDKRRDKIIKSLKLIGFTLKKGDAKSIDNQFRSFIGQIKNNIQIVTLNNTKETKNVKELDYEGIIVAFELILNISIPESISLGKFVNYEKQAQRKIKEQEKAKK